MDVSIASSCLPVNMAEVSRCFRRGAHDFAQKIYNYYLLKCLDHRFKSAIQTSSPSVGFLAGYVKNDGVYEAENTGHRVRIGASELHCYTSVTPLFCFGEDFRKNEKTANFTGDKYNRKPHVYSLCNKSQCLSNAKFGRSLLSSTFSRRLWAHGQFVFVREYGGNGTRAEPLYKTKTGYYDILGVLPSATHVQIKTAYYKQSFIYHPDRNSGSEETTVCFSEINEAYTILGNKVLRRKYDRGLLSLADLTATGRPPSAEDTAKGSTKTQTDRRRTVMGTGVKENVYDFDKFYKFHYGEQLQREKDIRARREEIVKEKKQWESEGKLGNYPEIFVLLLGVFGMFMLSTLR